MCPSVYGRISNNPKRRIKYNLVLCLQIILCNSSRHIYGHVETPTQHFLTLQFFMSVITANLFACIKLWNIKVNV